MNKAEVVRKVSEMSGVDEETCVKVIDSLEKVVEEGMGSKLAGIFSFLRPKER